MHYPYLAFYAFSDGRFELHRFLAGELVKRLITPDLRFFQASSKNNDWKMLFLAESLFDSALTRFGRLGIARGSTFLETIESRMSSFCCCAPNGISANRAFSARISSV